MYYVKKTFEIAGAHKLSLPYESKCQNLHGHNWLITVYCKSQGLNDTGMVADFATIKRVISGRFDHKYLNDIKPFDEVNPTAENMAAYIQQLLNSYGCYRVDVQESSGNWASYTKEEVYESR